MFEKKLEESLEDVEKIREKIKNDVSADPKRNQMPYYPIKTSAEEKGEPWPGYELVNSEEQLDKAVDKIRKSLQKRYEADNSEALRLNEQLDSLTEKVKEAMTDLTNFEKEKLG